MIDIICITDNGEATLGAFFGESRKYLGGIFDDGQDFKVNVIDFDSTTISRQQDFNDALKQFCKYAVVVAYSHGNVDEFKINGIPYIDKNNSKELANTFVYSTACSTAKGIGKQLKEDGCLAFVGYKNEAYAEYCDKEKQQIIIKCDHACLYSFLSHSDKHIVDAYRDAIKYYNREIEYVDKTMKDILFRNKLIQNREALTILYNKDITRQDLEH